MKQHLTTPHIEETEHLKLKKEKEALQKELNKTQKELQYKEKALAEAAALLVLQKKVHALLADEDENTTSKSDGNSSS